MEARAGVPQRLALMARLTEIAVLLVDCLEGLVREVAPGAEVGWDGAADVARIWGSEAGAV